MPASRALLSIVTDAIDRAVIEAGADLKVVANVAVGYNNIDVAAARERGIVVTNTPDVLTEATADLTWALILDITRRLVEGDRLVRRGEWKGWAFDFMLGIGAARQAARHRRLRPDRPGGRRAGARRSGCASPTPPESQAVRRRRVHAARSAAVDVGRRVTALPADAGDRHLINQTALARMKRSAYLINTARGPVVDEAALVWALRTG